MKTEQCLMCVVCFVLGWFVHNIVGKCGREHLATQQKVTNNKQTHLSPADAALERWHAADQAYTKCAVHCQYGGAYPGSVRECREDTCPPKPGPRPAR
jgi:hypothetical protein